MQRYWRDLMDKAGGTAYAVPFCVICYFLDTKGLKDFYSSIFRQETDDSEETRRNT